MGQSCSTIIYAVACPSTPGDALAERVYDACHSFKAMSADRFWNADLIGLELATGGSGSRGAADLIGLTVPFDLAGIEEHDVLGPMLEAARAHWPDFVQHVKTATKGKIILADEPRVYLTETETA